MNNLAASIDMAFPKRCFQTACVLIWLRCRSKVSWFEVTILESHPNDAVYAGSCRIDSQRNHVSEAP